MKTIVLAVVVVQAAASILISTAPAPAPAGAAPAGGPAAALNGLRLSFEIKNYNYYDLTKETCPKADVEEQVASPSVKGKNIDVVAKKAGKPQTFDSAVREMGRDADKFGENTIEKGKGVKVEAGAPIFGTAGKNSEKPPWMNKKDKEAESLLETDRVCAIDHKSLAAIHSKSDACKSVADVFRAAIEEVVRDVLKCNFDGPVAPEGVASSPAAFLQKASSAPAAAVATAPAAAAGGVPNPAIFVTFSTGKKVGRGKSVMVEITFTDQPENGMDDVALAKPLIQKALDNGSLVTELKTALQIITGITAKFGKRTMEAAAVEAWNVKKCEAHVKKMVNVFSHTYTKEQVPMAMYNECTNFMTKMSFSNDHVLDRMDTVVCRQTTAKFAKHWDVGEKAEDKDFELMCVRSCESKFGKDAPQCNVAAGDKLAGKPL